MPDFLISKILNDSIGNLDTNVTIRVPEWAFKPDHWSVAFLRGLSKLTYSWKNKCVWEVGVGTGINLVVLRNQALSSNWYFSDYDARFVPLAMRNLLSSNGKRDGLHPLYGSWDLVTPPSRGGLKPPRVDIIFGCLPQVPSEIDLSIGDRLAHYYDPAHYPSAHLNALGLGLVETLLIKARDVLAPGGKVVLNLGGRPGLKSLRSLFSGLGYKPTLVHKETIPQHSGTSLASLVALEGNGHCDFEFFSDCKGSKLINARKAEKLRVERATVYHNIYVMAGTLA
ncbi:MAG: hypothetical protein ABI430_02875 [Candidatus Taylorbacteria bacterium]